MSHNSVYKNGDQILSLRSWIFRKRSQNSQIMDENNHSLVQWIFLFLNQIWWSICYDEHEHCWPSWPPMLLVQKVPSMCSPVLEELSHLHQMSSQCVPMYMELSCRAAGGDLQGSVQVMKSEGRQPWCGAPPGSPLCHGWHWWPPPNWNKCAN